MTQEDKAKLLGKIVALEEENAKLKEELAEYDASFKLYWKASNELRELFPHTDELTWRDTGQQTQLAAEEIRSSREVIESLTQFVIRHGNAEDENHRFILHELMKLGRETRERTFQLLDNGNDIDGRFETQDNNLSRLVLACKYLFEDYTMVDDCLGLRTWWKSNKHRFERG